MSSIKPFKFWWGVASASYLAALCLALLGYKLAAMIAGGPALFFSGWAFFGHFATLDDDLPGEWSNQEGSKTIWYRSVLELFLKLAVIVILVATVYA